MIMRYQQMERKRPAGSRRYAIALLGVVVLLFVPGAGTAQSKGGSGRAGAGTTGLLGGDVSNALSQMNSALEKAREETTPEDEYRLGRAVAASVLQSYRVYTKDPGLTGYVNRICQVLAVNSPQPVIFNGYHVLILDSQEMNAFATPGGHIFLTIALVKNAKSEDALAAVIAHELAHIHLHHALSLLKDVETAQGLSAAAGGAAELAARDAGLKDREALFRNNVAQMVDAMMINGYAQAQEFEADSAAVSLLKSAGYSPSGLTDILRALQQTQRNHPGGFNSTHPSPAQRLSRAQPLALSGAARDTGRYRQARFNAINK
jgi:predicted Zn-dependent protease